MPATETFSINELINCIVKVNQRVATNYLKNFSGYHHDVQDISSTYSDFINNLFTKPAEIVKVMSLQLDYFKAQQDLWKNIFINQNPEIAEVIDPGKGKPSGV